MDKVTALKKEGLKGSFWNFLNIIVNQLRNFIVSLVLARLLTPTEFGLISMALVLGAVLEIFIDFGFSSALIREKTISPTQISTVFFVTLIFGLFCSISVFFCAPLFSWFFHQPALTLIVQITSWGFFINAFSPVQYALLVRNFNFKTPFYGRLISGTISGIVGICGAFMGWGVWALVVTQVSGWILYNAFIWIQSTWFPRWEFDLTTIRPMISFGWKLTISTLINRIYLQLNTIIIGRVFSASLLGLYNRAHTLNHLVVEYSFNSIKSVLLPTMSRLQDDKEAMRHSLTKLLNVIGFLTFLFAGTMYVCSNNLILFLYGKKWIYSAEIFKILAIFSLTQSLPFVYESILTAQNKMTLFLKVSLGCKVFPIVGIIIGIKFGFITFVWLTCIGDALGLLLYFIAIQKTLSLSIANQIKSLIFYLISATLLVVLFEYFHPNTTYLLLNLIIEATCFIIPYLLINHYFKTSGFLTIKHLITDILHKKNKIKTM